MYQTLFVTMKSLKTSIFSGKDLKDAGGEYKNNHIMSWIDINFS